MSIKIKTIYKNNRTLSSADFSVMYALSKSMNKHTGSNVVDSYDMRRVMRDLRINAKKRNETKYEAYYYDRRYGLISSDGYKSGYNLKQRVQIIKNVKAEVRNRIKRKRENMRYIEQHTTTVRVGGSRFSICSNGSVNNKPNKYVNLSMGKLVNCMYEAKSPLTPENHVGIEIECFIPASKLEIAVALYKNELVRSYADITTDGSLRQGSLKGEYKGYEIRLCIPESKLPATLQAVITELDALGSTVNQSCGLHVHLDMRNRDKSKSFHNLVTAQKYLTLMQPKTRRNGRWCKTTRGKDVNTHRSGYDRRYTAINKYTGSKSTLEVRLHTGTINYTKIMSWCDLLMRIADHSEKVMRCPAKLNTFADKFRLPKNLENYIEHRIKRHAA